MIASLLEACAAARGYLAFFFRVSFQKVDGKGEGQTFCVFISNSNKEAVNIGNTLRKQ